jgi:hypothetical protein
MKVFRIFSALLLCHLASSLRAAAPATFADSFLSMKLGNATSIVTGTGLFYFAGDGTFRLLSFGSFVQGGTPYYYASTTGTYTYSVDAGDPSHATLLLAYPQAGILDGFGISLEYTGSTTGSVAIATLALNNEVASVLAGTFTQLVHVPNNYLVNVSNRTTLRTGDAAISGFVIQGTGSRLVLVRVDGPSLAQFGVSPVSLTPELDIFQGTGTTQIGTGGKWDSGSLATGGYDSQAMSWIFSLVGAFPLNPGSNDLVYFSVMTPGVYTAQASDPNAGLGGSALTEAYILPYSG